MVYFFFWGDCFGSLPPTGGFNFAFRLLYAPAVNARTLQPKFDSLWSYALHKERTFSGGAPHLQSKCFCEVQAPRLAFTAVRKSDLKASSYSLLFPRILATRSLPDRSLYISQSIRLVKARERIASAWSNPISNSAGIFISLTTSVSAL